MRARHDYQTREAPWSWLCMVSRTPPGISVEPCESVCVLQKPSPLLFAPAPIPGPFPIPPTLPSSGRLVFLPMECRGSPTPRRSSGGLLFQQLAISETQNRMGSGLDSKAEHPAPSSRGMKCRHAGSDSLCRLCGFRMRSKKARYREAGLALGIGCSSQCRKTECQSCVIGKECKAEPCCGRGRGAGQGCTTQQANKTSCLYTDSVDSVADPA